MDLLAQPSPHQDALERASAALSVTPVLSFPSPPVVLDLSGPNPIFPEGCLYTLGRYNEHRAGLYRAALFDGQAEQRRTVHMGLDLGAPVGTEVYAWTESVIYAQGALSSQGDYGHSVVLKAELELDGRRAELWSLYGHLSASSLALNQTGAVVSAGALIGTLGAPHENGGWPPHLHFQLSWSPPEGHDLPGAVTLDHRQRGLWTFPDPRLILGALY